MYNGKLTPLARGLRKNMTKEERLLWYAFLRKHEPKFYRQRVIGNYIADFYCSAAHLIVELDGSQHYEPKGLQKDFVRTEALEKSGYLLIRIPNNEIKRNFEGVCEYITRIVAERMRTPQMRQSRISSP